MHVEERVPFTAGDGMACNLVHITSPTPPSLGPVLLVHGAGVRANLYQPPTGHTLVDELVAAGYDVWLENWRASIDLPANRWSLDQAARYDHPEAVRKVLELTGAESLKAIIHCQGSTSFMMAAVAGLLPGVSTIITNAVSLHPVVPAFSAFKLNVLVPLVGLMTDYLNPQWGLGPKGFVPRMITTLVNLTHHECDNPVCKQVSFTYGTGWPTLWSHENLNDATHDWIKHEFAAVPMRFFKQMARCVRKGNLVAAERLPDLPQDFTAQPPKSTARIVFLAGEENRCFLPESQAKSHAWYERHQPGRHTLHRLPGYGHLDPFLGKHAHRDIFPLILEELAK